MSGRGDLCDVCSDNLVVEGEDYCRACLMELEAELWRIEQARKTGYDLSDPKHPRHYDVYADLADLAREPY